MRKITADYVHTVSGDILENTVIVLDENGKVLALDKLLEHDSSSIEKHNGHIIPGLVNTHCHLELSHMKGKVNTGTGLVSFVNSVVTQRNIPQEEIQEAIRIADQEMWDNGIMAVGDISNVPDTFATKEKSKMKYYTFLEMFDMLQEEDAISKFEDFYSVYEQLNPKGRDQKSVVPHAPYSVSQTLFDQIKTVTPNAGVSISVHNQETPAENELAMYGTGGFIGWYESFNLKVDHIKGTGKTSIHYLLQNMNPQNRNIFVHNTLTSVEDIQAAHAWSNHTYWASCPNANLYIENNLPNYQNFLDTNACVTLGTDSLTSNWQLSILEEMKTIQKYQSYVPFETLLKWGSLNGAKALGYDDELGSIEIGKKPGILLLQNFEGQSLSSSQILRLV